MTVPGTGWDAPRRRRPRGLPLILAAVLVAAIAVLAVRLSGHNDPPACRPSGTAVRSFVPAFFDPAEWSKAVTGGRAPAVMILNPASGPGSTPDASLQDAVRQARADGTRVIGYIGTKYGQLPADQVRSEVRDYRAWYRVGGIFLDQTPPDGRQGIGYYTDQARFIRQTIPNGVIWINPGDFPDRAYMSVADVVMVFEGPFASYQRLQVPGWVRDYPAARFAHTVYATPAAGLTQTVRLAGERNAGFLFATPGGGANPYGAVPGYWDREQVLASSGCAAAGPG